MLYSLYGPTGAQGWQKMCFQPELRAYGTHLVGCCCCCDGALEEPNEAGLGRMTRSRGAPGYRAGARCTRIA